MDSVNSRFIRIFQISVTVMLIGIASPHEAAARSPNLSIPPSDRVLSVQEVKNFWINTTRMQRIPREPSRLHPDARAKWKRLVAQRQDFIEAIRSGDLDTEAELAQLKHNTVAWRLQGHPEKSEASSRKRRELETHLARLQSLSAQRLAALAQADAAVQIRRLDAERLAMRSSCQKACCTR